MRAVRRTGDVPPQDYPASPQPCRSQAPPAGWRDDVNYQSPTQAWGGAGPRFQGTPPWWINPGPRYGSPQSTPTPLVSRGSWFGGPGRGFAGREQWFNSNRERGFQRYGRGFGNRAEDEQPAERYEDPTPRLGLDAESRPGRGRGRGRGCYACGTFGCHSRNHVEEQAAELGRYEQPRSSSVPPGNRSQGNGPRSLPTGNRAPSPVTTHPPVVPVGLPLQFDGPPIFGPIWTGTPDGPRTSTNITDDRHDTDLTDVKTPQSFSSFVFSTVNAAVDANTVNSAIVDATATGSYVTKFLVNLSRFSDVPVNSGSAKRLM